MNILNFGSLNIDNVYHVEHFVEAGETISSIKMEKHCGGKGLNQSIALARAGANIYHAGCIGKDGEMLLNLLRNSGADVRFVRRIDEASGHAIIQVDKSGQNCILLYGGANKQISDEQIEEVIGFFEPGDLILLQNEINNLEEIIKKAYQRGLKIALNPSPIGTVFDRIDFSMVEYLILNEIEGHQLTDKTEPDDILDVFNKINPNGKVVLTLGKNGAVYSDSIVRFKQPCYSIKVVDTTGAGDTFTGYFLAGISMGWDVKKCMDIASRASALAVSVKGASPSIPTISEVNKAKLSL